MFAYSKVTYGRGKSGETIYIIILPWIAHKNIDTILIVLERNKNRKQITGEYEYM
jgi:hypothetical protein